MPKRRGARSRWTAADCGLEFLLGPVRADGPSREELAELWPIARESVLRRERRAGMRSWAWWAFDRGMEPPSIDDEALVLLQMGELSDGELQQLLREGEEKLALAPFH